MSLDSLIHRSSEFTVKSEQKGSYFQSSLFNRGNLVAEFRSKIVEADALIPFGEDASSEYHTTLPFKLPVVEEYRLQGDSVFSTFDDETDHQLAQLAVVTHRAHPIFDAFAEEGMTGFQQFVAKFSDLPPKIDEQIVALAMESEVTVVVSAANFNQDEDYSAETLDISEEHLHLYLDGIEANAEDVVFSALSVKSKAAIIPSDEPEGAIRSLTGSELKVAADFVEKKAQHALMSAPPKRGAQRGIRI